jgi:uncharacterized protein with ATP-grasp and redox domains
MWTEDLRNGTSKGDKRMQLEAECYPCMMNQALRAARLSGLSKKRLSEAMQAAASILGELDPSGNPPLAAAKLYSFIAEFSGEDNPYEELKEESNRKALLLLPELRREIESSADPLSLALRAAVAGNIVDFGASENPDDLEDNLRRVLGSEPFIDHTPRLRSELVEASEALLICDNAGEIVMDRLLCEVLRSLYPRLNLTAAVRGGPTINDATLEDAREVELDRCCEVISTGLALAGIDLERSSRRFRETYHAADVILAKGQGNFETLEDREENIYLLFQVKCDCVSKYLAAEKGDIVISSLRSRWQ